MKTFKHFTKFFGLGGLECCVVVSGYFLIKKNSYQCKTTIGGIVLSKTTKTSESAIFTSKIILNYYSTAFVKLSFSLLLLNRKSKRCVYKTS